MNRTNCSWATGLVLLAVVSGCEQVSPPVQASEPEAIGLDVSGPPVDMVVVVDLSGSLTPPERANQQSVLMQITESLSYGDRLVVQVAHARGVKGGAAPVVAEMPSARNAARPLQKDVVALGTARRVNASVVGRVFEGGEVASTDLIATMHTAANRFTGLPSRSRTLVVLSDMLQCAGDWCFEKGGRIPDATWIERQQAAGTVPDLAGACVAVVGADPSTAHGVQVREFWRRYFEAAGAQFAAARYRHDVADVGQVRCG